jgi:hypothetical protein
VVLKTPLKALQPDQHFSILSTAIKSASSRKKSVEIVFYKSDVVENDLFQHPLPKLPETADLFDIGLSYIIMQIQRKTIQKKSSMIGSITN